MNLRSLDQDTSQMGQADEWLDVVAMNDIMQALASHASCYSVCLEAESEQMTASTRL